MSVQSEIDRIITAVGNAYSKVSEKGGTVPASQTVANLATAIDSIPAGGGAPSLQSKSVTYTSNGTATITPDAGYDGLSSVDVTVNVSGLGDIDGQNTVYGIDAPRFRLSNCKMKNFTFQGVDSSFDLTRNVTLEKVNFEGCSVNILNSDLENLELELMYVSFIRCSVTCSQTFYDAFLAGANYYEDTNFNIV